MESAQATADTYTPADLYGPIANSTGYIFPGAPQPTCRLSVRGRAGVKAYLMSQCRVGRTTVAQTQLSFQPLFCDAVLDILQVTDETLAL